MIYFASYLYYAMGTLSDRSVVSWERWKIMFAVVPTMVSLF